MNEQQTPKYVVQHAEYSAVGDYAHLENNFPTAQADADPGVAELRRLFEDVNRRLAALETEDREQVAVEVEQVAKLAAEIQQGDPSAKKQQFLETRLKHLAAMAPDIAQVIIATLLNPAAGIALVLQKIAQKAQAELRAPTPAEAT